MTMILGLTGGIASGKSLVTSYFEELGYPTIDADLIAREVVEPGTEGLREIEEYFGPEVIQEDGSLNRSRLGEIVFSNEEKREVLNRITHSKIRETMMKRQEQLLEDNHDLIVLDIPLLYEGDFEEMVDVVMVVVVDQETQIKRLMERDSYNYDEATNRIESQMALEDKAVRADIVINNNGKKENTYKQVDKWLAQQGLSKK